MPAQKRSKKNRLKATAEPLTLEEIALYKALPVLTLDQVSRILQKPVNKVYELSRARAKRPIPTFKSGKSLCSNWDRLQRWIEEGFAGRAA